MDDKKDASKLDEQALSGLPPADRARLRALSERGDMVGYYDALEELDATLLATIPPVIAETVARVKRAEQRPAAREIWRHPLVTVDQLVRYEACPPEEVILTVPLNSFVSTGINLNGELAVSAGAIRATVTAVQRDRELVRAILDDLEQVDRDLGGNRNKELRNTVSLANIDRRIVEVSGIPPTIIDLFLSQFSLLVRNMIRHRDNN